MSNPIRNCVLCGYCIVQNMNKWGVLIFYRVFLQWIVASWRLCGSTHRSYIILRCNETSFSYSIWKLQWLFLERSDGGIFKMSVLNICSILMLLLNFTATCASDREHAPLEIIWHVGTPARCEKRHGVSIDVRQYGMLMNSDPGSTATVGEVITVLYQHSDQLGRWPYIKITSDGTLDMIHGGLPQVQYWSSANWHNAGVIFWQVLN